MKRVFQIFEPQGFTRDVRAAFPFLWKIALVAQGCLGVWMLGPLVFGVGFAVIGSVFLWISVLCIFTILCSIFWMAAQPNRDVAVLSPWTILKDKFTSRRPNG